MAKRLEPDEILKQIVKLSTGRHKIYLGMAPAVGKTYRMLEDARELRKKGIDIVIGYIENQGRSDNLSLIQSFEHIPSKQFIISGKTFYELDVEAVIERRPATVIIDELAHSNIPGSLNQKRYEDVQEILKNGISVLSTLNIHHLESISPVVEKNLGIKISETVPDWVLNNSNEVVLIDVSVDELYDRFKSKNIYTPEQLKHAMKNFFKKSNLHLLRDLALNVLAERVDVEVVSEKLSAKIKDRILVACKPELDSVKLIKHAGFISSLVHGDLDVLCILKNEVDQAVINSLREISKECRGNFFLLRDIKRSVSDELVHFINLNRITQVVMGFSKSKNISQLFVKPITFDLMEKTSNLDILILGNNVDDNIVFNSLDTSSNREAQSEKHNFGKLKIYIGMAPGVGKTYKMLQDGKKLHDQGKNVLLGVIDTHGRVDTTSMTEGLNSLPLKLVEHKNKFIHEFDLESAILAKPDYILVDELAHTNVPGSINNKRYQDVQYLLRAGINVMSTVNIQHIESLNDIVEQVTGIKVRETVPDWIVSHSSEIVLIDLSPEALQERLKAGKIYTVDKIEQALSHFFQKKNLIALRELSLREVAESVEHELYPKHKQGKILCLVDINVETLRLIRKSARLASRLRSELIVIHIAKDLSIVSETKKLSIIELEQLVVELGGDFRLIEGQHIVNEVLAIISSTKPNYIVIGEPIRGKKSIFSETITKELLKKISGPHVWIVGDYEREISES